MSVQTCVSSKQQHQFSLTPARKLWFSYILVLNFFLCFFLCFKFIIIYSKLIRVIPRIKWKHNEAYTLTRMKPYPVCPATEIWCPFEGQFFGDPRIPNEANSWFSTTWQGGHVGSQNNRIFSRRINLKIEFSFLWR